MNEVVASSSVKPLRPGLRHQAGIIAVPAVMSLVSTGHGSQARCHVPAHVKILK